VITLQPRPLVTQLEGSPLQFDDVITFVGFDD